VSELGEGVRMDSDAAANRASVVPVAIASLKWAASASWIPKLVSPLSTALLAYLLTPNDFGVAAAAAIVVALAQLFATLGLGSALVQHHERSQELSTAAFWAMAASGILLYGLAWTVAPVVEAMMGIALVSPVLRFAALSIPLSSISSVPVALMQRDFKFRRLFWVEGSGQACFVVSSLFLALNGYGVWALVVGPLIGLTARTIVALALCEWRPSFKFRVSPLRNMSGFGGWMVLSGLLSWVVLYADNALAGRFFGGEGLGVYSLGFNLGNLLPGMVIPVLSSVAYPAFCSLQKDPAEVGRSLLQLQRMSAAIVFPMCFGLASVAPLAVGLVYGEKWKGLGEVMAIIAIMPGLSHIWSLSADAWRAVGRPDLWVKVTAASILIVFPSLILIGSHNLLVFTVVRAVTYAAYPLLCMAVGGEILGLSFLAQLRPLLAPISASILMFLGVYGVGKLIGSSGGVAGFAGLLMRVLIGIAIYGGCLFFFDRDLVKRLRENLFRSVTAAN
jgi:O-antigen/teichoic acid export membrane protein